MTSYYSTNPSTTSDVLVNRIAQEVIFKSKTSGTGSEIALVAKHGNKKMCSNPVCLKPGHTIDTCFAKGGGMEGKMEEVMEGIRKKKKAEKAAKHTNNGSGSSSSSSTPAFQCDSQGHAYITDSITKEAILLAECSITAAVPKSSSETALAAIQTDLLPPSWSMSTADDREYNIMMALEDKSERSDSETAYPASSNGSHVNFIIDSRATTHISPDLSNFSVFNAIKPWVIKGVGGASISAVGIGKVELAVASGSNISLDNVLYVLQAGIRLISVKSLALQNLNTSFTSTGCKIINSTGIVVATGTLTSGLYTLDTQSTPDHTLIAARIPDLETWHQRLGHVNIHSIIDLADKGMVKGMYVNLSSEPPKCQQCILRKQT